MSLEVQEAAAKPAKKQDIPKRSFIDIYNEFAEKRIQVIKQILEENFPDRWDFQKENVSVDSYLGKEGDLSEEVGEKLLKRYCNISNVDSRLIQLNAYSVYIHFPEITVKNADNNSIKMTDLYVKIPFNPYFSSAGGSTFFLGNRTSYTYGQYAVQYKFSHLSSGLDKFTYPCLGGTDFATLCLDLYQAFDENKFYLWCMQLEDYFSWESLSGGPYISLNDVRERDLSPNTSNNIQIDSYYLRDYYKKFIENNSKFNVTTTTYNYGYSIHVIEDDTLRESVTKCVIADEHLQIWDDVNKQYVNLPTSNRNNTILSIEKEWSAKPLLTYKGKQIFLTINDKSKSEKVIEDDRKRVAHRQIVSHIIKELNQQIKNFITNDFIQNNK